MEIKTIILISFSLGFISALFNDEAKKNFYGKLNILDHIIVLPTTIFLIYIFFISIYFGFVSFLQFLLGAYIGRKVDILIKHVRKNV